MRFGACACACRRVRVRLASHISSDERRISLTYAARKAAGASVFLDLRDAPTRRRGGAGGACGTDTDADAVDAASCTSKDAVSSSNSHPKEGATEAALFNLNNAAIASWFFAARRGRPRNARPYAHSSVPGAVPPVLASHSIPLDTHTHRTASAEVKATRHPPYTAIFMCLQYVVCQTTFHPNPLNPSRYSLVCVLIRPTSLRPYSVASPFLATPCSSASITFLKLSRLHSPSLKSYVLP